MVAETVVAFIADDDVVGYLDVQEFAACDEFLGQQPVILAWTWVARRMVVPQNDAGCIEVQGVFEDDFRVGDDMGGAAVADAFHFQGVVALVEVHDEEMLLPQVFDIREKTFKGVF